MLAEPTLVTISGRTSSFHSGGELVTPASQKDSAAANSVQEYGTRVDVTPEVIGGQRVRLAIHCRLSELDPGKSVGAGKDNVPGLQTTEFHTSNMEVQDGQTAVLSGPVEVRMEAVKYGVPWVSEMPGVGKFFRNVTETRSELTTLVLVRCEIVRPLAEALAAGPSAAVGTLAPQVVRPVAGPSHAPTVTAGRQAADDMRR